MGDGQLHPAIPPGTHPALADLLAACFDPDPMGRPSFGLIVAQLAWILEDINKKAAAEKQATTENAWGKWWGTATTAAAAAAAAAPPLLRRPGSRSGAAGH